MENSKEQKHQGKIRGIFDALQRLQFPFSEDDLSSENEDGCSLTLKQIMMKIGKYIQGTESRLYLLEWLVNIYKQGKTNSKLNKNLRIQNLVNALDSMGMLPNSKHTKSMDYQKYVQGLLGFEASVTLVYKLASFVQKLLEVRKRNRPDSHIVPMMRELCENKPQLVNVDYDPFGIIVPEMYSSLSAEEFNKKYSEFMMRVESRKEGMASRVKVIDDSFMSISKETKERFRTTMTQMIGMIQKVEKTEFPKFEEEERSRLVDIDGEFVNTYRKFISAITFQEEKGSQSRASLDTINHLLANL